MVAGDHDLEVIVADGWKSVWSSRSCSRAIPSTDDEGSIVQAI